MTNYALAAPAALVRPFGIALAESASRSEVRAVYGGFGLAIAGVLGYAAIADGEVRQGVLITVAAALAGMALGRLAAAVLATARRSIPTGSTSWWSSSRRFRYSGSVWPNGRRCSRRCRPRSP
jgi:hypothetical protein